MCAQTNGLDFEKEAAMAKYYASDAAMRAAIEGVQIFGGNGYMKDYPAERHMRDAKICQIYEGTNEIQRVVVARKLIGLTQVHGPKNIYVYSQAVALLRPCV